MDENGVTRQYKELTDQYQSIPFAKSPRRHQQICRNKSPRRLVLRIADQERQIRKDPSARTTNLLKEVFGKSSHSPPSGHTKSRDIDRMLRAV